ncbi:hydrogenase maturation protease [Edaphobacter paludis]|uniref:Hydrogenase maturation protease n=1 Tax=Edaphobacter paludis TaxID=3035702 RepID=A0AAU7D8L4_9BACT
MTGTILIAGIGNIFLGDDAFGVEVARSLSQRTLPSEVQVKDFGIRGFDLAYTLLDPWHTVILVDALPRKEVPGTLFVLEPDLTGLGAPDAAGMDLNPHGMDPMRVLNLAASLGPIAASILVVGCEPRDFGDELEGRMGLSPQVQATVEEASNMIEELIGKILESKDPPMQVHTHVTGNREVTS